MFFSYNTRECLPQSVAVCTQSFARNFIILHTIFMNWKFEYGQRIWECLSSNISYNYFKSAIYILRSYAFMPPPPPLSCFCLLAPQPSNLCESKWAMSSDWKRFPQHHKCSEWMHQDLMPQAHFSQINLIDKHFNKNRFVRLNAQAFNYKFTKCKQIARVCFQFGCLLQCDLVW